MPASSPEGSPSMAGLMTPGAPPPQPDVQEQAKAVMNQIRQIAMTADALASQFPVAAPDLQVASKALQQAMVKIVTDVNRTQTTPPTPQMLS